VALSAYVEAIAYTQGCGVPAAATQATTRRLLGMLEKSTEEAALNIESGEHETDQATIAIFLDGMRHSLPRMQGTGRPFRIFAATMANLEAAVDAGFGDQDLYAQSKAFLAQKGTR